MTTQHALPNRETHVAGAILRVLRNWKRVNDRHGQRPWMVTDEDLRFLEEWAEKLAKTWDDTKEMFERSGLEIVEQPSAKDWARR